MIDEPELDREDGPHVEAPGLDNLLDYLHESRGFDFDGYKRMGLERRLLKRVRALGLQSFDDYIDYLEIHPNELDDLFDAILINATGFFRDPAAWEQLARQAVPQIIEARRNAPAIRVWSAGCATGQEAYTAAMVLAEALGMDAFTRKVKIYATDVDDDALAQARQATYTPKELANVPPALVSKYFERSGSKHVFLKAARRCVIFGRQNLLRDAPISRVDLLLCRNTLMYFNAAAQAQVLAGIHFALAESGVLFLGRAEMLLTHGTMFTPLDLKHRLFTKVTRPYARGRTLTLPAANQELEITNEELQSANEELQGLNEALLSRTTDLGRINLHFESILASLRSALVVLDRELRVQVWSARATELWGVRGEEVRGKHFFGLDIGLPVDTLRDAIKACLSGQSDYVEAAVSATNRRGKAIQCSVKISRLHQSNEPRGIIVLMDESTRRPD